MFSVERLYPSSLVEVSKSQKMLGLKKILGQQKLCVNKNYDFKKKFGSKQNVWPKKMLGPQKSWLNKIGSEKILGLKKMFGSQKNVWYDLPLKVCKYFRGGDNLGQRSDCLY